MLFKSKWYWMIWENYNEFDVGYFKQTVPDRWNVVVPAISDKFFTFIIVTLLHHLYKWVFYANDM